jgi:3-oxoacyl-[acyl-carrier protein] reductase
MFELSGKVCLVVGASGYIGGSICSALADQGGEIIAFHNEHPEKILGIMEQKGGDVRARIHPVKLDITQKSDVSAAVSNVLHERKRIDVLVYAAGATLRKSALLTSSEDCQRLFELNFDALVHTCKVVLRSMLRQSSGRLILIGSAAGEYGMAGQSIYAASKAAVHVYARSLAQEVGHRGITVNVVAPGALLSTSNSIYSTEDEASIKGSIGLQRLGSAYEVAAAVAFLASDEASYISGEVLAVDGAARF